MSAGAGPQPPWQPPGGSWPGPGPQAPGPPWPPGGAPPPRERRPYNPLAVVAFVASFLGPVGALLGPGLGAVALAQMRARPGQRGRALAQGAVVIGLVFSLIPLIVFAFLSDRPLATLPFALLFAYGVAVAFVAFRRSTSRERVGMAVGMVGGSMAVVLAVLLAVGASYAFIYGVKALGRYVGHQVRCSVTQTVHRDPTCPQPARTP